MLIDTDTNQVNSQSAQALEENQSKERVKAGFSVLDHFVKIYNSSETYIKRGLTLFGLGSILAGASFGGGQQLPSSQQNTSVGRSPSTIYVQVPTQPSASVPQQVAPQKSIQAKPASLQIKTPIPTNRTMVNHKPTSVPIKASQRVATQKIVRAKSTPAQIKAKMPVRPVSRVNRNITPSVRINATTPKQIKHTIVPNAAPRAIAQETATKSIARVKQVVAPLRPTNKNN